MSHGNERAQQVLDNKSAFLSEGTYSSVWEYKDPTTNENKVLKIYENDDYFNYELINNIFFSKCLNHRAFLNFDEILVKDRNNVLCICKNAGMTLFDFLCIQKNKLTSELAFYIIEQIVDGLYYLHSNGIFHGDLHLRNILINSDNKIKIIDYGMMSNKIKGLINLPALNARAPELQFKYLNNSNKYFDSRKSDMYSLGIIINLIFNSIFSLKRNKKKQLTILIDKLLKPVSERITINDVLIHLKMNIPFNKIYFNKPFQNNNFERTYNIILNSFYYKKFYRHYHSKLKIEALYIFYQLPFDEQTEINYHYCISIVLSLHDGYKLSDLEKILSKEGKTIFTVDMIKYNSLEILKKIDWNIGIYKKKIKKINVVLSIIPEFSDIFNEDNIDFIFVLQKLNSIVSYKYRIFDKQHNFSKEIRNIKLEIKNHPNFYKIKSFFTHKFNKLYNFGIKKDNLIKLLNLEYFLLGTKHQCSVDMEYLDIFYSI